MPKRPINFKSGTSERIEVLWPWICAVECWQHGEGEPLASLMQKSPIPVEW